MSDLALDVKWQEILRESEAGDVPHCMAIAVPATYHQEIIASLARVILGSYRLSHPDLLIIGSLDKAPPIGDPAKSGYEGSTRWLIENIALKPLESSRRMGVILSADKLLLPAANSLLKLAEEPPEHVVLLFLMEDGRLFLPTLRSRSRFTAITLHDESESERVPSSPREWVKWLEVTRKGTDGETGEKLKPAEVEDIAGTLAAWRNYAVSMKNYVLAERIDRMRLIAEKKNLSVPMLCDMIILMLGDDNTKHEHILDDLW